VRNVDYEAIVILKPSQGNNQHMQIANICPL